MKSSWTSSEDSGPSGSESSQGIGAKAFDVEDHHILRVTKHSTDFQLVS